LLPRLGSVLRLRLHFERNGSDLEFFDLNLFLLASIEVSERLWFESVNLGCGGPLSRLAISDIIFLAHKALVCKSESGYDPHLLIVIVIALADQVL
jgi:hypothetical protein